MFPPAVSPLVAITLRKLSSRTSTRYLLSYPASCTSNFLCNLSYPRFLCSNSSAGTDGLCGRASVSLGDDCVITFETGQIARQANGAVLCSMGNTVILATTVRAFEQKAIPSGMLPLTVRYQERASATGRIPTNFLRRELASLSDAEVLASRAIDRSVRPFFPDEYRTKTDLTATLIAADGRGTPDVIAINGASAALAVSQLPWRGPVGAVRVGVSKDDSFLINPGQNQRQGLLLDLLVVGTADQKIVMMEMCGKQAPYPMLIEALRQGVECSSRIATSIETFRERFGKPKIEAGEPIEVPLPVVERFDEQAAAKLRDLFSTPTEVKRERGKRVTEIRQEFLAAEAEIPLEDDVEATPNQLIGHFFGRKVRETSRKVILDTGIRPDGREFDSLRPVTCEMNLYPALHGTGLFTKGQSQVLATVTLDSKEAAFRSDPIAMLMGAPKEKRFLAHYQFNQFATNDLIQGSSQGSSRRDVGHSRIIENALRPLIPGDYPFTIRLVCDVLESAGSTSMASVGAGFLALKDAGIPLMLPTDDAAVGIALGAVMRTDSSAGYDPILMDITGFEDFINDMDLKVATTRKGFMSLQMDCKVDGVHPDILTAALEKAYIANNDVIDKLVACVKEAGPRPKENSPVEETITLPGHKKAILVRNGAYILKRIQEESGVRISPLDENTFSIFAYNPSDLVDAKSRLAEYLEEATPGKDLEFGGIYPAKILEIQDRGVIVSILPGIREAFVPVRQLDSAYGVSSATKLGFTVGQEVQMKYFGLDPQTGKPRLSRKILQRMSAR